MGKSEGNSETWLVTYSDMVTLLLVFFVLLYTLSPGIDKQTFENMVAYFQNNPGVLKQNAGAGKKKADKKDVIKKWEQLKAELKKKGLESEVAIQRIPEGIKITLSDSLTFNSGSAKLLPAAKDVLTKMANIIDKKVREVEVQGHTDNVPIISSSIYQSNWHLGAARAVSVVVYIQKKSKVEAGKFKASSYGKFRPVATNKTEAGRRRNRRVEIYVRYKKSARDQEAPPPMW